MIVLKPNGGLCNRLRAIDSAVVLSRTIHQPLKVLWTLSPELNCGYYSLFEPSEDLTAVDILAETPPSSNLFAGLFFLRDYAKARLKYQRIIFQSQMNRLREQKYDFTQLSRYKSVYITCCNRFFPIERRYRPLRAIPSIQSKVDDCVRKYSSCTVGVHIRRTDHHTVSPYASTQGFIDAMNRQIKKNAETTFFLASDSPDIISQLTRIFKDRVMTRPANYSRNSEEGIKDALIDLLCLSKTHLVIGSHFSSFSGTAAQLNDIPAIYIKPEPTGVNT